MNIRSKDMNDDALISVHDYMVIKALDILRSINSDMRGIPQTADL